MPRKKNSRRSTQLINARNQRRPSRLDADSDSVLPPTPVPTETPTPTFSPRPSSSTSVSVQPTSSPKPIEFTPCSRTVKKLKLCEPSKPVLVDQEHSQKTIVDLKSLSELVCYFNCPSCVSKSLSIVDKQWVGLAVELAVQCRDCSEVFGRVWTSDRDDSGHGFSVNRVAVLASLQSGFGSVRHNVWCENMGIPGLHHKTFQKHAGEIYKETPFLRRKIFLRAAALVRQEHARLHNTIISDTDVVDIAVSYDATWLTRGHTSHIGVVCVIEVVTGLVLDCHVMSTFCHKCQNKNRLKETDPAAFETWYANHIDKKECDVNFMGELKKTLGFKICIYAWGILINFTCVL